MFDAIMRLASDGGKTPGEVIRMENYHRLHANLSQLKVAALDVQKKDAKTKYNEALNGYVTKYFGRPLNKLNVSLLIPLLLLGRHRLFINFILGVYVCICEHMNICKMMPLLSLQSRERHYSFIQFMNLQEFFEGVQAKVSQGVKESEIGYQMAFSRAELKRVIKEYPAKEVKKGLESLYKKVEKHLSEDESLLQVIILLHYLYWLNI